MNLKRQFPAIAVAFAICAASASIASDKEYIDSARIISTSPILERVYAPSRECSHSAYSNARASSDDPTMLLFGALAGGAIGSQIGQGDTQDAAAAIGALFGSKVATGGAITGEELLGAVAGGVIGNQIGGGSGKTAATAVGTILGSAMATGKLSTNRHDIARECGSNVVSRRVITKYEVEYRYNDLVFTGILPYKPTSGTVDVLVNVDLLEDATLR